MAEGGLAASNADICISITGIAGPDGGSSDKPVGTVYMGVATKNETQSHHFSFLFQDLYFKLELLTKRCLYYCSILQNEILCIFEPITI